MTQWGLKGDLTRGTPLVPCKKCNSTYNTEDKKPLCEIRQVTSNLMICSERRVPNTRKAVILPLPLHAVGKVSESELYCKRSSGRNLRTCQWTEALPKRCTLTILPSTGAIVLFTLWLDI